MYTVVYSIKLAQYINVVYLYTIYIHTDCVYIAYILCILCVYWPRTIFGFQQNYTT